MSLKSTTQGHSKSSALESEFGPSGRVPCVHICALMVAGASHGSETPCEYAGRLEVCTGEQEGMQGMGDCGDHRAKALEGLHFTVKGLPALGGSLGEWTHMCSLASPSRHVPWKDPAAQGCLQSPGHPHNAQLTAPCPALFSAAAEGAGLKWGGLPAPERPELGKQGYYEASAQQDHEGGRPQRASALTGLSLHLLAAHGARIRMGTIKKGALLIRPPLWLCLVVPLSTY